MIIYDHSFLYHKDVKQSVGEVKFEKKKIKMVHQCFRCVFFFFFFQGFSLCFDQPSSTTIGLVNNILKAYEKSNFIVFLIQNHFILDPKIQSSLK